MRLALLDAFSARWTETIHEEWTRNLLANRPDLKPEQLIRTKNLMNDNVRDSIVEDYEYLIDSLILPDLDDRHVLAAAIRAKAKVIVTFNLRDFPPKAVAEHGIKAINPDDFIVSLIKKNAEKVGKALQMLQQSLKKPPRTVDEVLTTLEANGLKKTVELLRQLPETG